MSRDEHCFICGMRFATSQKRYQIVDVENTGTKVYLDQPCYERVREIRRAQSGTYWEATLELSERLQESVLGLVRK